MKYKDFKLLSKEDLMHIVGGVVDEDEDLKPRCIECQSDDGCTYKPDLYCGWADACSTTHKVCKRSAIC